MSVLNRALPGRRRTLERVCIAAAIVAAGATALTIQAASGSSEAQATDAGAEVAPERGTPVELRRVSVTPADRIEVAADPEPVDALTTALVARLDLVASPPDLVEVDEVEPEPVQEFDTSGDASSSEDEQVPPEPDPEPEAEPEPDPEPEPEAPSDDDTQQISTSNVPLETWEAVARCESGYGGEPDWSINTGNGFYGGLQFTLDSWEWVGGTGYPHEASKATQIEMAERLWELQGWDAWPACSSQLGLR